MKLWPWFTRQDTLCPWFTRQDTINQDMVMWYLKVGYSHQNESLSLVYQTSLTLLT